MTHLSLPQPPIAAGLLLLTSGNPWMRDNILVGVVVPVEDGWRLVPANGGNSSTGGLPSYACGEYTIRQTSGVWRSWRAGQYLGAKPRLKHAVSLCRKHAESRDNPSTPGDPSAST